MAQRHRPEPTGRPQPEIYAKDSAGAAHRGQREWVQMGVLRDYVKKQVCIDGLDYEADGGQRRLGSNHWG